MLTNGARCPAVFGEAAESLLRCACALDVARPSRKPVTT